MVPMEARQSMLEDPSRGSKQTTYLPFGNNTCKYFTQYIALSNEESPEHQVSSRSPAHTLLSGSTIRALSFSSVINTQEVKEDLIMLMTRSLERTSSFFTWSPVMFVLPAMPYLCNNKSNRFYLTF